MTTPASRVPSLLLAALLLLGAALFGTTAYAGTLQIRDEPHLLAGDDAGRLRAVVAEAPFDARLVFTSSYADSQELSRYVHSLVSEPDIVVVGVDPTHHHVQVHFGTGSRIPASAWPGIERAGNDAFRRGDWEGGAAAIFREAAQSVVAGGPAATGERAEPARSGPGFVLFVIVAVIGIGLVAAFLLRRRNGATYPGAGAGYPPGGPGPGYGPGGYGYGGVPPQGGMGPIGGGLIGAGLGGLAGYELGKAAGEREERDREDRWGGGGGSADDDDRGGGNLDAGGGGSDWDDGGGGGGFDGGGGDGGGGGSDF